MKQILKLILLITVFDKLIAAPQNSASAAIEKLNQLFASFPQELLLQPSDSNVPSNTNILPLTTQGYPDISLLDVRYPNKNLTVVNLTTRVSGGVFSSSTKFIFPDVWDTLSSSSSSNNEAVELADKFAEIEATTKRVDKTTQSILSFRPTRPFHGPNPIFYPQPSITSNPNELQDKFQITEARPSVTQQPAITHHVSTPISLEYQPSRPSFLPYPLVYPEPSDQYQKPSEDPDNNLLADKFQADSTTTLRTTTKRQSITRPPVTQQPITHHVSTPISLEYQPSRPSFLPYPLVYPEPSDQYQKPSEDPDNNLLVDKFQTTSTTTTRRTQRPTRRPQRPITQQPAITHHVSSPISLEYKPIVSSYLPYPLFYPETSYQYLNSRRTADPDELVPASTAAINSLIEQATSKTPAPQPLPLEIKDPIIVETNKTLFLSTELLTPKPNDLPILLLSKNPATIDNKPYDNSTLYLSPTSTPIPESESEQTTIITIDLQSTRIQPEINDALEEEVSSTTEVLGQTSKLVELITSRNTKYSTEETTPNLIHTEPSTNAGENDMSGVSTPKLELEQTTQQ